MCRPRSERKKLESSYDKNSGCHDQRCQKADQPHPVQPRVQPHEAASCRLMIFSLIVDKLQEPNSRTRQAFFVKTSAAKSCFARNRARVPGRPRGRDTERA